MSTSMTLWKEVSWILDRHFSEWRKGSSATKFKIPSWAYSKMLSEEGDGLSSHSANMRLL